MARKHRTNSNDSPSALSSVPPQVGITLIEKLIGKAEELREKPNLEFSDEQPWVNLARDYLTRIFGSDSANINSVIHASGDGPLYSGMSDHEIHQHLRSGFENKIKLLRSCMEQLQTDIELQDLSTGEPSNGVVSVPTTGKVFVVHGHNDGIKEAVARFLDRLGLEPIILHEKPNAGRTIIEKFSDYADVQFAVVLLTADDEGRAIGQQDLPSRARQNVVLELGYFLGKLGRARVCALYDSGVEIPSDYQGVLFVELDQSDRWRFELVRELQAAGFDVDANRIFE